MSCQKHTLYCGILEGNFFIYMAQVIIVQNSGTLQNNICIDFGE